MKVDLNKFRDVSNTHASLAQFYRWFQVYERPLNETRFRNQLDMLADEVHIESMAGKHIGREGLWERLSAFDGWQNAHHVKKTVVAPVDEDTMSVEADLLYQNIRPDGTRYSYTIHYVTRLDLRENELPLFSSVVIKATGNIDHPLFEDAYIENRARSFMHYWCWNIETANGNAGRFRELLADEFELHLSSDGIVNSFEQVEDWINSTPGRIKMSAHYPKNFSFKENEDHTIAVSVDFEWRAISADGKEIVAETHHKWTLVNNPDERFARMKNMRIDQVKALEVVKPWGLKL